ncbi:Hypothetical protein, putative [Bodo saltans]|uniref:Membrane-associated protein n=1 Tax=Bodo saltans TaxID=75058 RepID=A0A0S4JSQ2_BODSA|nr:Hypothetical protein, putative [Bodo saltans]|eukprot:CUG92121.1 Hypothetical protein, putative [Bodo saltans]
MSSSTIRCLVALATILLLLAPTIVSAQCSDGDGECTCAQCAAADYSYWCPSNLECYSYDVECADCDTGCKNTQDCSTTCYNGYNCTCDQCGAANYAYSCASNQECYSLGTECSAACNGPCKSTQSCSSACSDGYNCTCTECNVAGYPYFCPTTQECYNIDVACNSECGVSCTSTQNCSLPVACTAAQSAGCPGLECCLDSEANPFCVASGSVCCNYAQLACPAGSACDAPTKTCRIVTTNQTTACKACQSLVSEIESQGCSSASDYCVMLPPPFDAMCALAFEAGLCTEIVNYLAGHLTPLVICEMIPIINLCATGLTCECGYCQPAMYGNWCLALDAPCPSSSTGVAVKSNHTSVKGKGGNICFDGMCDESNAGCCLTCAP